jgi:acyl-CoA thioester hydrolase
MPYELDFTGFVCNTVALRWMERLRLLLMEQCFPKVDLNDEKNVSVIRRAEVDYLQPIRLRDRIMGRAFVKKGMSSSWVIGFSFMNLSTAHICIEGSQTGVFIDATTLKPKRMPLIISHKLKSGEV